jgi:hypothetical protein
LASARTAAQDIRRFIIGPIFLFVPASPPRYSRNAKPIPRSEEFFQKRLSNVIFES